MNQTYKCDSKQIYGLRYSLKLIQYWMVLRKAILYQIELIVFEKYVGHKFTIKIATHFSKTRGAGLFWKYIEQFDARWLPLFRTIKSFSFETQVHLENVYFWRRSVTNQLFSWADGFGHKHEGGACSIVFHCPLPPGETFFFHPTICEWGKRMKNNLSRWTLEVKTRAMSTWTRRRSTRGRTRRKVSTTGTGWSEARSPTPGSSDE